MKEFKKQYQNEPVDFHLWSQNKIANFWWRAALEWVKREAISLDERGDISRVVINRELEDE